MDADTATTIAQLNLNLAAIRSELTRTRDIANTMWAKEFESIDDQAWQPSGKTCIPIATKPGPWKCERIIIYTAGSATTLQLRQNDSVLIPIATGLTVLRTAYLFESSVRPQLADTSNVKMYLAVQGFQIVTQADPV